MMIGQTEPTELATLEAIEKPVEQGRKHAFIRGLAFPLKRLLIRPYWSAKAFWDDWQDYSAELIGSVPIHSFRLWWLRHVGGMHLGKNTSIHRHCRIYRPYRVSIGDHSVVNYGVLLDGRAGLCIGNNVSISEGTVILTLGHDIDSPDFALEGGQVMIGDYAFVGSYARILPGVTIGEGAVVGVGAVVTHDVAPYTVVGGVPARYIRDRCHDLPYCLQYRKRFG